MGLQTDCLVAIRIFIFTLCMYFRTCGPWIDLMNIVRAKIHRSRYSDASTKLYGKTVPEKLTESAAFYKFEFDAK